MSPLRSRGEGSRKRDRGVLLLAKSTPLLHYVQLPPYFAGGTTYVEAETGLSLAQWEWVRLDLE